MIKKQVSIFILLALFALNITAQTWTAISSNTPAPFQKTLTESSDQRIVLQFNVPGFYTSPVETTRGTEYIVTVPEMFQITELSTPDLPWYGVSAIIPDLALMKFRVVSSSYTDFEGISIAPSKGHYLRSEDPNLIPFTYGTVYNQNAFHPEVRGQLQEPFILRDFRGQVVNVQPFAWNPISKTLRVYHELVVELYNDGIGGENQLHRSRMPEVMAGEFISIYSQIFINYQPNRQILQEEGKFLIIAHSSFMDAMQPLVEWKKTIGRPTELVNVATIGTTTTAIKAFVLNYYNTHGLTHLLLVGDHQQVPSQSMSGGFSDNFYGYLAGNDSYNEVFVGRFSAETPAHAQTQVQRTIHYERNINETDTWLNTGIGIARNEGTGNGHNGGENDYVHMNYIRDSLLNYTYSVVHREYDGNVPGITNTNASQMSQRINTGASIINFCNHGSISGWSVGGFSITHVNALTNVGKLPFIWSVACDNGRFTSGTCFAESWMRATHNTTGEPTGAIATMMSWISQPWQPPMTGQDEMVTILVERRNHIKRTMGGVSINGSAKMIAQHGTSGRTTHDTWLLFGDPTLTLRTNIPTPVLASHPGSMAPGATEFTVNADANGSIVALTINGEILGTGYIQNGSATITFPALPDSGVIKLAIFGYNRVTYLQEIEIMNSGLPGDSNCDGTVNLLDGITSVNYVMGGDPQPFCPENADVTNDGIINVLDIIGTVNVIMGGK